MILSTCLTDHFAQKLTSMMLEKYPVQTDLAKVQIILPTRRACRTVKEAFLQQARHRPMLLPQLTPLYDLDVLSEQLPPACPPLDRTILLTQLCRAKPNVASTPAALKIALGLGQLLDEFYQFEISTDKLETLIDQEQFAEHWNQTISFLDVIRLWWPRILKERGQIDSMDRTVRFIDSLAKKINTTPPDHPIVLAGFDGGIKAVNRLIKALNKYDNTLILLDGFDFNADEKLLNKIDETHPLFKKNRLLKENNVKVDSLKIPSSCCLSEREQFIWRAFCPDSERYKTKLSQSALSDVHRLDCSTAAIEAQRIALIMRQVLETPEKTAALVTTDRTLSRRVISEMERWGVHLDDSAGTPLLHTPIGVFLSLLCDAALAKKTQKTRAFSTLFKHPFVHPCFRQDLSDMEITARRKQKPFLPDLPPKTTEFLTMAVTLESLPATQWLTLHTDAATELALGNCDPSEQIQIPIWDGEAGQAAFDLITALHSSLSVLGPISIEDYRGMMNLLMMGESVRPNYGTHPRLSILGPIEARLFHPDVCIIGSLNEGTFPDIPETGPWLNRPMRKTLGLPLPEIKTASLAADFAHCFCAKEVWLTRCQKNAGTPTIPSRFLSRLEAVAEREGISFDHGSDIAKLKLDEAKTVSCITRPTPCPPVSKRPRRLSATRIETWMRNPYAIYARYILKLYPLSELESQQTQQVFGSLIHEVLEDFFTHADDLTSYRDLIERGEKKFKESPLSAGDLAFFMPKFHKMALFITSMQRQRQRNTKQIFSEVKGEITLPCERGDFVLEARADRIDLLSDGTAEIIDYKTGTVPSSAEILAGYAPQLPLEGLIFNEGGFKLPTQSTPVVPKLTHWKLKGRGDQGGEVKSVLSAKQKDLSEEQVLYQAKAGLERLIDLFDCPETPYEATPVPGKAPRYDDYAHLARTKEWMNDDGGDE